MTHARRGVALLAAVLALPLTLAVMPSANAAPPSAKAVPTVCSGVEGCKRVASADVDGDGKPDQVGVVYKEDPTDEYGRWLITVRVKTATDTSSTTGRDVDGGLKPVYGVASIDGHRGKEIVVADSTGANTYWFRVITYRKGRLTTLKPPVKSEVRPSRWAIQSSDYFQYGFSRRVTSAGTVNLVEKRAERNQSGKGYSGKDVTYKWKHGRWAKVSSKKRHYSSYKAAHRIAGWHVKGLSVWP